MPTIYSEEEYEKLFGSVSNLMPAATPLAGWGDRVGAAFDRGKSNLLGVGEAMGADVGEARRGLQFQGEVNRAKAVRDTGAPASLSDISSAADLGKGVAGLFADSAPELGLAAASGGLGAVAGLGTLGRTALGVATQYPMAVGDIVSNQREQAGKSDVGAAGLLGVPYAAASAVLGVEGALMRGRLPNVGRVFDAAGLNNRAARYAGGVALNALGEGTEETFQEGMNQFGRMAVDPEQEFFDDKSLRNFGESFVGGALMGGTMGLHPGASVTRDGKKPAPPRTPMPAVDSNASAANEVPLEQRPAFDLQSYDLENAGPDAPQAAPGVPATAADPRQMGLFDERGQPTYAADPSFSFEELPDPIPLGRSPTTSLGAGQTSPRYGNSIDYAPEQVQREIDTGGLSLVPQSPETNNLIDYASEETDPTSQWSTALGAAPPRSGGLDFNAAVPSAGNLTLRAPTNAPTPDMFGGPARTAADVAPPGAPFELTPGDAGNPNQMELPLAPPAAQPMSPAVPIGAQRGITGQLPFSVNTTSPKGQVLQGLLDSLAGEGHVDESDHIQLSTLIAQGKFSAAKKAIDAAVAEKQAADAMVAKAQKLAEKQDDKAGQGTTGAGAARGSGAGVAEPAAADGGRTAGRTGSGRRPASVSNGAAPVGDGVGGNGVAPGAPAGDGRAVPAAPAPADAGPDRADTPVRADVGRERDALTDEELIEQVDNAKTDEEYRAALDAMYDRWLNTAEGAVADYVDANSRIKSFAREWDATEARYDAKTREGRKGLRMGQTPQSGGTVDTDTDTALRGMGRTLASTAEARGATDATRVTDPDADRSQQVPDDVAAYWGTGHDAMQYFRTKGSTPFIRYLASVLSPHVRNVPISVLTDQEVSTLPPSVREDMQNSAALYVMHPNGDREVIVKDGKATEATVMHEVLHAATVEAMDDPANAGAVRELQRLRNNVVKSLHTMLDNMTLSPEEANALAYFIEVLSDPNVGVYEYVSYTMSSPTFRALASRMNADGTLKPDAMTPSSNTRPSLMQRFVDAVLSLLGVQRVYQKSLIDLVNTNEVPPLLNANLEAIESLLAPGGNAGAKGQVPGAGPGAGARTLKSAASTQASPETLDRLASVLDNSKLGGNTLVQRVKELAFNAREARLLLPALTNDQIAESYKKIKGLAAMNRATGRMGRVANNHMEMTSQVAKKWNALISRNEAAALEMQKLMLETTMLAGHVSVKDGGRWLSADEAWAHENNKHMDKADRAAFNALHARFMSLPAEARMVYDAVRDDLAGKHREMIDSLEKSIVRQHASELGNVNELLTKLDAHAALNELEKTTTSPNVKKMIARTRRAVNDVRSEMGTVAGPYFPLTRFGDHVVVVRSSDMTAALQAESSARDALQAATFALEDATEDTQPALEAAVDEAKAQLTTAREAVEKFKRNGEHYEVSFYESAWEARQHFNRMREAHPGGEVYETKREEYMRGLDGASPAFMRTMQDTLDAALRAGGDVDAATRQRVMEAANDLYLRRSPERSALRNELRRMSVEGVKAEEMLRGYVHTARGNAWRISRLMHADEVVAGMGELVADKSPEARDVLNEMKRRFAGDYAVPNDSRMVNGLQQATYFMHLGFNASYMLANLTQSWVVSLPMIAGRHGGMLRAGQALAAASKEVVAGLRNATAESIQENGRVVGLQLRLTDAQLDALGKTEGERAMLRALTTDGVIDITIKHDLGAMTDGAGGPISKAVEMSSSLANFTELYNRLSTALAAYRLELERHDGSADAQTKASDYAERILTRTHFNYSPENAPRIMRGNIGRLVFQFKRYTQGMLYLFASLVKQAYKGDKDAQRSLFYVLGTHWAVAGTAGLPVTAPFSLATSMIAALFPDDDEPELKQQMYNGIKDAVGETAARVLVKGLPTLVGADLSGKLGAGDLLNPAGFARTAGKEAGSQDWMAAVFFALAGPGVGQIAKQGEAIRLMADGKMTEGAISALPTFMSAPLGAWRQANEGVTSKRGDVLINPEDIGWGDAALKTLGFQTVKTSDMYSQRSAYLEMVNNRKEARTKLMQGYYKAVKDKDPEAMAEARQAISEFNKRQPADAITPQTLRRGLSAKSSTEMRGGLRVGPRDEDTYRRLTGED